LGGLLKTGDGAFLGTTFGGGEFGVVHRLSETGTVAQVASFGGVVGRYFTPVLARVLTVRSTAAW
jgi:hypothetical protein